MFGDGILCECCSRQHGRLQTFVCESFSFGSPPGGRSYGMLPVDAPTYMYSMYAWRLISFASSGVPYVKIRVMVLLYRLVHANCSCNCIDLWGESFSFIGYTCSLPDYPTYYDGVLLLHYVFRQNTFESSKQRIRITYQRVARAVWPEFMGMVFPLFGSPPGQLGNGAIASKSVFA